MKNIFRSLGLGLIVFAFAIAVSPSMVWADTSIASTSPKFGSVAGGTAVTITGSDFENGTIDAVTIGGVTATSIVVVDDTTITAVTPAGIAGSRDVVVTTSIGGMATLFGGFTYVASPSAVDLGTAGDFAILSKSGITTTGSTHITGNLGISPAVSTDMTGFGLVLDGSGTFATSALVTGRIYAADYSGSGGLTPAMLTAAVSDMEAVFTDANSRATGVLNAGDGDLGGLTLPPGVYTFDGSGDVSITSNVTFAGGASDVWIFQIPGNLSIASATEVLLTGGAVPENIFWAVSGTTTLGTDSVFAGTILGGPATTTIAMQSGAILTGKALGQKEVTLIGNTISDSVASDTNILAAGVTGVIKPVRNEAPATVGDLTADDASYTVTSLTWSPADDPFAAGTVYTATFVLTSEAGYKFPVAGIPAPTTDKTGTISAGVTAGGDASGNTLTFTEIFSKTQSSSSSGGGGSSVGGKSATSVPVIVVSCAPGQAFSAITGEKCTSSANIVVCPQGDVFSAITGERCTSYSDAPAAPWGLSYAFGNILVKKGTRGEACRAWQTFFNDKINAGLAVDGICGPKTMAVATSWQASAGLKADGLLGALSRARASAF